MQWWNKIWEAKFTTDWSKLTEEDKEMKQSKPQYSSLKQTKENNNFKGTLIEESTGIITFLNIK